ncbi:MAG: methylmalonyl-CoA mutase, partial [Deltaproteobacteria bacterium]|nr:methylmalonyl-CoA mutase [Deltaproteobacteria bacterium]
MGNVRIVIGMMGMDQHEVGAIAVSRILMEAGMEVIYLGRFQSPASIVNAGIDEAADII